MAINNIEQVKWIVHKILPAVYDEALSYYEVLCKVIAKLNEVIANEDAQNEMLVGFDERLTDVEEAVSEIESDIRGEITDVLKTYNGYANGKFLGVSGDEIKWVNMPTVITSYDSLTDKPQINGVTLSGNKTSAQLDIKQIPAGGVVGQVLKKLSDNDYDVAWGSSGGGGGGGTTDYTDLENKPQINGVTLAGNKSTADLSLGDMKKADYDSDDAVDEAGGIAAYVDSAIGTATSGLMAEADYDDDEIVKDAGGIVPYVENKVVASVVQNFPEDSQFDVVMDDADDGEVASTVILGKTVAQNQLCENGNFADASGWDTYSPAKSTIAVSGNVCTQTIIDNTGVNFNFMVRRPNNANGAVLGHKYFVSCDVLAPRAMAFVVTYSDNAVYSSTVVTANAWTTVAAIGTGAARTLSYFAVHPNNVGDIQIGDTYKYRNAKVIDLTAIFSAADLATIGTSVDTFKTLFLKKNGYPLPVYIPFNTGSLANVDGVYRLRGRNIWDEEWEQYGINTTNGQNNTNNLFYRSKNYIPIFENKTYYFKKPTGIVTYLFFYDAHQNFIRYTDPFATVGSGGTFAIPSGTRYMRFCVRSTAYAYDICINVPDPSFNGTYEAHYNGGEIDLSSAPLNGIGTAQDEKDFATGKRTTRCSGVITLDGDTTIADRGLATGRISFDVSLPMVTYTDVASTPLILSDKLKTISQNASWNPASSGDYVSRITTSNTTLYLGAVRWAGMTLEQVSADLTANPIHFVYAITPVTNTETAQPVYTQKGYNVLEPINGDVQSGDVNTTYLHLLGGLFARKADLVNGKVPDSQLPDFGEANVINFDSIVSGTTTIPADDRTKLSDMTKPCEIHIGTAVYHRATPFKFYWEQKGTVLNVVKILEINSSTYIITETTMFASYATTATNKVIPETGTNGVWKLVANKTVASDASNTGFTYTELLGGNYDEYMVVVKGKAKGNVSVLNTNSGGTSLSNTITYREGASASISNNQSAIPATNGNYFEATLTLKNYISFGSGNGGYFALYGNVCDGDSTTQSTYFIQCAWKIAYAGTYAIGFNNLAKDSEIRLYGRNTGDYVFPNPL